jgi:crossover junction endodeoxyribonuclease RusA
VRFYVIGKPRPQGSMRTLIPLRGSKPVTLPADQNIYMYRGSIQQAFRETYPGHTLMRGPIYMDVTFTFRRPDSHYKSQTKTRGHREELRPEAPDYMAKTPDLDKLMRAVCDALTGVAYHDDAQVPDVNVSKVWGEIDATDIDVSESR